MSDRSMLDPSRMPVWLRQIVVRPRLMWATVAGLFVGVAARMVMDLQVVTSALVGWDALCIGFIASALVTMRGQRADDIRRTAEYDDEGRPVIQALALTAAIAAVVAIGLELSLAKQAHGLERGVRIALAFVTVAASWFMVHLIFAYHYAHAYYDREQAGGPDVGGLKFPGDELPDYWDFLHFSLIIGVASQTADIAITSKEIRRLGTVHSLFSFAFNTVIVALTINLLAGLFS